MQLVAAKHGLETALDPEQPKSVLKPLPKEPVGYVP